MSIRRSSCADNLGPSCSDCRLARLKRHWFPNPVVFWPGAQSRTTSGQGYQHNLLPAYGHQLPPHLKNGINRVAPLGSQHDGGGNFAFADGTVHFLSSSISTVVLPGAGHAQRRRICLVRSSRTNFFRTEWVIFSAGFHKLPLVINPPFFLSRPSMNPTLLRRPVAGSSGQALLLVVFARHGRVRAQYAPVSGAVTYKGEKVPKAAPSSSPPSPTEPMPRSAGFQLRSNQTDRIP